MLVSLGCLSLVAFVSAWMWAKWGDRKNWDVGVSVLLSIGWISGLVAGVSLLTEMGVRF